MKTRLALLACALLLPLGIACGTPQLSKSEIETQATNELEKVVGQRPDSFECPDDLDAKVGNTTRCTLGAGELRYGVTVTITAVDGSTAKFDIKVDDQPMSDGTQSTPAQP